MNKFQKDLRKTYEVKVLWGAPSEEFVKTFITHLAPQEDGPGHLPPSWTHIEKCWEQISAMSYALVRVPTCRILAVLVRTQEEEKND